jgi:long-chain acyl-CoA synthetase
METFQNLVDMFQKATARHAARPLFGVKRSGAWQWLTYGEIAARVDAFRAGLAHLGVGRGDRVALISDNSPEWAVAAYATYGLGAQLVPMYEAQLTREWEFILRDCGAKALLVANAEIEARTRPFIASIGSLEHVVNLSGPASAPDTATLRGLTKLGEARPVAACQPAPDEVCGFLYTSGTTGDPKGVLLTHGNITSNINAIHEFFPMGAGDVSLSFLPWAHSFGQTVELHALLSYGASMALAESVATILANLAEIRPTLLFSVPRIFNRIHEGVHKNMRDAGGLQLELFNRMLSVAKERRALAAEGRSSLVVEAQHLMLDRLVASRIRERFGGRLRWAFSGGAALAPEVAEFVDSLGILVCEGYGLTETAPIATCNTPAARRIGSVGKPIPGVRVTLAPVEDAPPGEGEIVIHGPNVMRGYHQLPSETAAALTPDGGFRTGDLGRFDADGFLYVTGRLKDHYKLENGRFVSPSPLEEQLRLSPYIAQIVIDGTNRPFNVAVIVPDLDALKAWAREARLETRTTSELVRRPEVSELLREEIRKFGNDFKPFERPERFILATEDFTTDNGLLTPSLKVRRRAVLARYADQLTRLYAR